MSNKNIIIVATHPIQYHAPWFRELANNNQHEVLILFGMMPTAAQQSVGFDTEFSWDIPLTDGYQWHLLENTSKNPNLADFSGVDCPSIYDFLKSHSPDVLVLTGWHSKMLLQATWAAKRLRIKTIMRGESNAKKPRSIKIKLIHRVFLKMFDAFLAIGKSNKEFLLDNGVPENTIFDAPYFVENNRFIESIKTKDRSEYGIADNAFCFVYAGKLITKKNVMEVLRAFTVVYKENRDTHFLIIGDGELREELEAFVEDHQLAVTFAGFVNQNELPSTYAMANCFVLGSDFDETWGLVVNEAMVCGLPAIVSSRAGCGEDLIIDSKTGFVYQYGDVNELATHMLYMVENSAQAHTMGQNARQHIVSHYHVGETVEATIQAISLVDKSR